MRRWIWLAIAVLTTTAVAIIAMPAAQGRPASTYPRVVARGHARPDRVTVLRHARVRLRIPRHVVKRRTVVKIVQFSRYGYDFRIKGPWHGVVTVSFPLRSDPPLLAHQQLGGWRIEPAKVRHGRAVIHVTHLSLISDIWTCVKKKSPTAILSCLALKGVRAIPLKIVKKLVGREYDPCLPVGPGNISIDPVELLTSPCHIGETPPPKGPPPTSKPTPQPTPSPTPAPTPSPTPAPTPQQPPARSIQIGWSGAHPGWIWMTLNGFSIGTHQYTCAFGSGGNATFTLTETSSPQTWDNGHTCYDLIHGDTVWVVIEDVSSNVIRVP